jgi:hypothetical protein
VRHRRRMHALTTGHFGEETGLALASAGSFRRACILLRESLCIFLVVERRSLLVLPCSPPALNHTTTCAQPRYQLFGASMDVVQSMEQSSAPGRVHLSAEFAGELRRAGAAHLVADEQSDGTAFLALEDARRYSSEAST